MEGETSTRGLIRRYLPELVYGSNDGLITTFAIVSGVVGASLSSGIVLILGLASLFADGFSMAASDFLSKRSDPDSQASRGAAARSGGVTFAGFVLIGAVPLVAYVTPVPQESRFLVASVLTLITLFAVGAGRAAAAERIHWLRGGLEMLMVGAVAAAVAYGIGQLSSNLGIGGVA